MKVLIISDSHGFTSGLRRIFEVEPDFDMLIHLGDGGANLDSFGEYIGNKPIYKIKGNCDLSIYDFGTNDYPERLISWAGDIKFFACHGHLYGVKNGLTALYYAAKEQNCEVAFFGHTHIPYNEEYGNIRLFNPGTASKCQYGLMEVKGKNFTLEHKNAYDLPDNT